jgi:hypothetical protein
MVSLARCAALFVLPAAGLVLGCSLVEKSGADSKATGKPSSGSSTKATGAPAGGSAPASMDAWLARLDGAAGCARLRGARHVVSMQAGTAYDEGGMVDMMAKGDVRSRRWESWQCGGQKVGVFLYELKSPESAKSVDGILRGFIWGGTAPSSEHPERIYLRDSFVLVVSSSGSGPIDKAI